MLSHGSLCTGNQYQNLSRSLVMMSYLTPELLGCCMGRMQKGSFRKSLGPSYPKSYLNEARGFLQRILESSSKLAETCNFPKPCEAESLVIPERPVADLPLSETLDATSRSFVGCPKAIGPLRNPKKAERLCEWFTRSSGALAARNNRNNAENKHAVLHICGTRWEHA